MLLFFFFNDTATTEIYTLSLHDALPILSPGVGRSGALGGGRAAAEILRFARAARQPNPRGETRPCPDRCLRDRKSTRLNSSHQIISYAVFCLKKKKKNEIDCTI